MEATTGTEYEIGDVQTLTLITQQELVIGEVFRIKGSVPGQSEVYMEVIGTPGAGRVECKVVGINIYVRAYSPPIKS